MAIDVQMIRRDFPILARTIDGKPLVYLDSAATSQKPVQVINAMQEVYKKNYANVHRGIYRLSTEATELYEKAHENVARFIGSDRMEEVVFTKNATESLNLAANSLTRNLQGGDEIIITIMEHHSNLVPWQQIAKMKGLKLKFCDINEDGTLDMNDFERLFSERTRIVSAVHMSNVLGTVNPVREISQMAHEHNAVFVLDGAQSVPHFPVDVRKIDCDFMAFSGHKMLGPTGIGVLYGKYDLLKNMDPFLYGGDMILEVTKEDSRWNEPPWRFEAGTPPIAEAQGLSAAVDYLRNMGMENIHEHEKSLTGYCLKKMKEIDEVEVYGPEKNRGGVIPFNLRGIHPHEIASILDSEGIAIRAGNHCAMPLMKRLGVVASVRASF